MSIFMIYLCIGVLFYLGVIVLGWRNKKMLRYYLKYAPYPFVYILISLSYTKSLDTLLLDIVIISFNIALAFYPMILSIKRKNYAMLQIIIYHLVVVLVLFVFHKITQNLLFTNAVKQISLICFLIYPLLFYICGLHENER